MWGENLWILGGLFLFSAATIGYTIYLERQWRKERAELINKIMARNYTEFELWESEKRKQEAMSKKPKTNPKKEKLYKV